MKKRIKHIIIIEAISIVFCISVIAKHKTSVNQYTTSTALEVNDQDSELSKSMKRGEEIYTDFCMQCHLHDGKGTPKVFPPLAGSDWLVSKRTESIYSVKFGLSGSIIVNGESYNGAMTPLGLEDEEIADVMNYIMNNWGNTQKKMVTTDEVANITKQ